MTELEDPPNERNYVKFLDEEIDKGKKYTNYWYNNLPNSTQFCCYIHLRYESLLEKNIHIFTGSMTYEYNYGTISSFGYTLVWNSLKNIYYLHDDMHKKKYVNELDDRYGDMSINGEDIVRYFFKNLPKCMDLNLRKENII